MASGFKLSGLTTALTYWIGVNFKSIWQDFHLKLVMIKIRMGTMKVQLRLKGNVSYFV